MNRVIVYSARVVALSAAIVFVSLGYESFSYVVINEDKIKQTAFASTSSTTIPTAAAITVKPIDIKVKNIVANKNANDKNAATIQVAFDVHNPNANTMILDGIHYSVYVNNIVMTSGNIGTEAPEDVIRSQNGFPIIASSTMTLKDTQTVQRNNMNTMGWNNIVQGKTSYVIKGVYSYRQTADLQASGGAKEFTLTFP